MSDESRTTMTGATLRAIQVPIEHRLREVPESLRLVVETDTSLSSTPVGHLCHEAADEIELMRVENAQLRAAIRHEPRTLPSQEPTHSDAFRAGYEAGKADAVDRCFVEQLEKE